MPAALGYWRSTLPRRDGLCSIFDRFDHGAAIKAAKELGVLREYIRGDADVLRDIGKAFDTYALLFAEQNPN